MIQHRHPPLVHRRPQYSLLMTTRHVNKLLMFLAVQRLCARPEFAAVLENIPAFAESLASFDAVVEEIGKGYRRVFALHSEGLTADKKQIREDLAQLAARVSASVVAWAHQQGDLELAHQAHVTKTKILAGRALHAAETVDHLLSLARPHLKALVPYGLTAERLERLAQLNASFLDRMGNPRAAITDRKCTNASLAAFMTEATTFLTQLDRFTEILKEEYPQFVASYRLSRKIHHTAATRSLSESEKANAAAREAKKALAQAKKDAHITAIHARAEATRAKAQEILAEIGESVTKREEGPRRSWAPETRESSPRSR